MTRRVLRLYVAGTSDASKRAEQHLAQLRAMIKADVHVEVIDVLQRPELAKQFGILATPTLSYEHPPQSRRVVGDLSDSVRVLTFLGLETKEEA